MNCYEEARNTLGFLEPKKENSRREVFYRELGISEDPLNTPNREEGSSERLEKETILPVCGSADLVRTFLLCFLTSVTRLAS